MYIVIDFEFNQSYTFEDGTKTEPVENCPFEIIQIGAVKMDLNLEIIDKKDFLIKPLIYNKIHPVVEKITCLTEEKLKEQKTFSEVYYEFTNFISGNENILCVWGGNDIKELTRNALYYGLDLTLLPKSYVNVQNLASKHLARPQGMRIGLKSAVESFKLDTSEMFHNALNDAVYTAEIFKIVKEDNMQIHPLKA